MPRLGNRQQKQRRVQSNLGDVRMQEPSRRGACTTGEGEMVGGRKRRAWYPEVSAEKVSKRKKSLQ